MKHVRTDESSSSPGAQRSGGAAAPSPRAGWGVTLSNAAAVTAALLVPLALMLDVGSAAPEEVATRGAGCVVVACVLCVLCACGLVAHGEARPRRRKLGAYTLCEKIGEGGMGIVFRAQHASSQRAAAIKLLPRERATPRNRARFELEVQRTSLLSHPNTISIFESGSTPEGDRFYAMEFVDGLDLQALVERDGPLAPGRVARVLVQVLGALAEAHRIGLVHRDVKPANIMLSSRGGCDSVKVLDFGLVQDLGDTTPSTDVDELVGTPLYLSPEALTEPERLDARSDLYAVGAVGYFLLTGRPPFVGRNVLDVCAQHLHGVPVPPSRHTQTAVPPELEASILRCLEKSPEKRPQSADELRVALEPLVRECDFAQTRPLRARRAKWSAHSIDDFRLCPAE